MSVRVEVDLRRAKELRGYKKGVHDPRALAALDAAADRLERNAAKKLGRIGRPVRRHRSLSTSSAGTLVG